MAVAVSPDGTILASGCMDKSIQLWNVGSGKLLRELQGYRDNFAALYSLAFSPDGKQLAAGGNHDVIRIWEVATGKRLFQDLDSQEETIRTLALSATGKLLATGSLGGTITVWDLVTRTQRFTLRGQTSLVYAVAFSPDDKLLASGSADCTVRLWDTATGKELRKLSTGKFPVGQAVCVAFSADGKLLASGHTGSERGDGSCFRIWDVATGKELHQNKNPYAGPFGVSSLAFSADGQRLTTAGGDGTLRHWQVATGEELSPSLSVKSVLGRPAAFSVDGKRAATRSRDGSTVLWDLSNRKRLAVLTVPSSEARVLSLSPDNRFVTSCYGGIQPTINNFDKTIRVWEIASGKEVVRFDLPFPNEVASVLFSPDTRTLFTGMQDPTVLIWSLVPPAASLAPKHAGPDPRSLEKLWTDLASEEAPKAYGALWNLIAEREHTVRFLKERLCPVAPIEQRLLDQLITDLGSDQFLVRRKATAALEELRELAEPALHQALGAKPGLEISQRLERLLQRLEGPLTSPTKLQRLRAIQILERIGSQEAQNLLKKMATGSPGAYETREAKDSLERLAKRSATP